MEKKNSNNKVNKTKKKKKKIKNLGTRIFAYIMLLLAVASALTSIIAYALS
ncbi:MAG: hypothetical protein ACI31S_04150 [Bacilli bacterium]